MPMRAVAVVSLAVLLVLGLACARAGDPPHAAANRTRVPLYHGCPVFAPGDLYNAPVTSKEVDPRSAEMIATMAAGAAAHPGGNGGMYYMGPSTAGHFQVNLADNNTPTFLPRSRSWRDARLLYPHRVPWRASFWIQGGNMDPPQSDQHGIVLNTQTCIETEMYQTTFSGGRLSAYSGWQYDLRKPVPVLNAGYGDNAAGVPIIAGTFKDEELEAGVIRHALNIVPPICSLAASAYVPPANSNAQGAFACNPAPPSDESGVPYGAHLRLKAGFSLTCACPQTHIVVDALKTYGAYISDTGSPGAPLQIEYMARPTGTGANVADDGDLIDLQQIHISDFEVLELRGVRRQGH
jgi:hypothetical protein